MSHLSTVSISSQSALSIINPPQPVHHYVKRSTLIETSSKNYHQLNQKLNLSNVPSAISLTHPPTIVNDKSTSFSSNQCVRSKSTLASSRRSLAQNSQLALEQEPLFTKTHLKANSNNLIQLVKPFLPPSKAQIELALSSEVVDQSGISVKFKDLIDRESRTVAIFIRHFRSAPCQKYIKRLSKIANEGIHNGDPNINYKKESLFTSEEAAKDKNFPGKQLINAAPNEENWMRSNGVKIIVIGNGPFEMIKSYKSLLNCPFPIYSDRSSNKILYQAFGMMRNSHHATLLDLLPFKLAEPKKQIIYIGSKRSGTSSRSSSNGSSQTDSLLKNDIHHSNKLRIISQWIQNIVWMPWKWSGDPNQLGGELVFEPIREEQKIRRKPISSKLVRDLRKTDSIRSTRTNLLSDSSTSGHASNPIDFTKPSCSLKPQSQSPLNRLVAANLSMNSMEPSFAVVRDLVGDIKISCKFIHRMSDMYDHISIEDLLIVSGIRLNSLIRKW
ncbi:hypothetical protein O181_017783 [Austropuccinia psidii MF-1]|uniref:Uncharacterized protein n=1 Tax=Austropuccinia psidii MF-1 TaxID=1389203 RepID=A0A9Q3C6Q6_9BASI|nr:hypothetical protein [Austropuccinia psidii MF-1]